MATRVNTTPLILVIGPSRWKARFHPKIPPEIEQGLPKSWPRKGVPIPWPVDLRAHLVGTLRQEHQPATLMEAESLLRT
jgi:hypothetical protein